MEAVKQDKPWDLVFPDTSDPLYAEKWDGNMNKWRELGGKVIKHKTVRAAGYLGQHNFFGLGQRRSRECILLTALTIIPTLGTTRTCLALTRAANSRCRLGVCVIWAM